MSELSLASGIPVHCAFDEIVDTVALVPNPRNPNKHPQEQVHLLAKIITAQGWRAPITVSKRSGFIVRGHCRLLAAQLAGWEEVPVDRQDYENEAAEYADLVADNRLSEMGTMSPPMLAEILQEMEADGFDLALTGFNEEEIAALNAELDPANFEPIGEDEQPRLDRKTSVTCPACGHEFVPPYRGS